MDNLKRCANILSETMIKTNRPKINLDIFPKQTELTKTAPQLDAFDLAVNRALNGEQVHVTKRVQHKPTARLTLTFDEAVKKRLG